MPCYYRQDLDNAGVATSNGILGNWVVNVTIGITYPLLGSTTQPLLDLNSVNVSYGQTNSSVVDIELVSLNE